MERLSYLGICFSLSALLVGCGGGSSGSDNGDPGSGTDDLGAAGAAQPGIYRGTITLQGETAKNTIMLLAPDGGFTLYNGAYISGDMDFSSSGDLSGTFDQYGAIDNQWQSGVLEGDSFRNGIAGSARPASGEGQGADIDFVRESSFSSYKGSLADLEGTWSDERDAARVTTLTIGANGRVEGSDYNGCVVSGTFDETDPEVNIYRTELTGEICSDAPITAGTYMGYAHFDPNNGNLIILDDNGENDNEVPFRRYVLTKQ